MSARTLCHVTGQLLTRFSNTFVRAHVFDFEKTWALKNGYSKGLFSLGVYGEVKILFSTFVAKCGTWTA